MQRSNVEGDRGKKERGKNLEGRDETFMHFHYVRMQPFGFN